MTFFSELLDFLRLVFRGDESVKHRAALEHAVDQDVAGGSVSDRYFPSEAR